MSVLPDRIKVVHIITKLELGGAQLNTLYTVANLSEDRFTVYLMSGPGGILDSEAAAIQGVSVIFIPELKNDLHPFRSLQAFLQIRRLLKEIKPHIVHTHSSKAGVLGRWAAWSAGVPVILHSIHGFSFSPFLPKWRNFLYRYAERLTSSITTRFIAVSQANIQRGIAAGILGPRDASLIRSGVDLRRFATARADKRTKLRELGINAPENAPIVTMVACLKPQKAPLDFVRAASHVHAVVPETHFLLAGDGELRPRVEAKIRSLHLEGFFHLLGWRHDVDEILSITDVFVLTSLWEGLPQVYPQALAAGVPVVGTDVDGADEVIHNNINGYLVPPRNITRIAESVVLFLQNKDHREKFSKAAAQCLEAFDRDRMVEQQEILYLEQMLMRSEKTVA